jgi:hypothetical protein
MLCVLSVSLLFVQTNNIFITFSLQGPSIRLADFGCARMLRQDGKLSPVQGLRQDAPEVAAAVAVADPGSRVRASVGPPYDVWCLGTRILPSLLPPGLCSRADVTWGTSALPLLAACTSDVPTTRPTTHQLSVFFQRVASGSSAATALLE